MGKQAESHVFLILKLHDIYMASTWLRHGKYTKKWGPAKERINNDQRFKKARAHQVEFPDCSAACNYSEGAFKTHLKQKNSLATNCSQLKIQTADGKFYL
jgi:hypothetical protein